MKIQSKEVAQTVNLYTKVFLEQKSKTFIIIQHHMTHKKISILLWLHCQPKDKHVFSIVLFCPRIALEYLRGNTTDVALESGIEQKSSYPQCNNAELPQRKGSLQVAAYSLHLRSACYIKSKNIEGTGLASQSITNPSVPVQILNYLGDSLWLDCVMLLQGSFLLQHGTKMTSLIDVMRLQVLKPNLH